MKLYRYNILALAAAAVLSSCNNTSTDPAATTTTAEAPPAKPSYDQLEKTSWLLGFWRNISPRGTAYEIWTKESDSSYAGTSILVKGRDTMTQETIRLVQSGADLYYIPTVSGQNGGQPVSFKMSVANADSFLFENPTHDFPTKISYKRIGADSLVAQISGKMNGKETAMTFPMGKAK